MVSGVKDGQSGVEDGPRLFCHALLSWFNIPDSLFLFSEWSFGADYWYNRYSKHNACEWRENTEKILKVRLVLQNA